MKYKNIMGILIVVAIGILSFFLGRLSRQEDYEAACHMSDLIRCYQDHLDNDSIYEDWGCFEELQGIFLYDDCVANPPVRLEDYSWCY